MEVSVQGRDIPNCQIAVPTFNFGQFQRWPNHEKLKYALKMGQSYFYNKIATYFEMFRIAEIEENNPEDFPELIDFKSLDWPQYQELLKRKPSLLEALLIFNDYDILHLVLPYDPKIRTHQTFYSIQSLDHIVFSEGYITLNGLCIEVQR